MGSAVPEFCEAREGGSAWGVVRVFPGFSPRLGEQGKDKYGGERGNDRAQHDGPAEALGGRERREEKYREAAGNDEHRGHDRLPHAFAYLVPQHGAVGFVFPKAAGGVDHVQHGVDPHRDRDIGRRRRDRVHRQAQRADNSQDTQRDHADREAHRQGRPYFERSDEGDDQENKQQLSQAVDKAYRHVAGEVSLQGVDPAGQVRVEPFLFNEAFDLGNDLQTMFRAAFLIHAKE